MGASARSPQKFFARRRGTPSLVAFMAPLTAAAGLAYAAGQPVPNPAQPAATQATPASISPAMPIEEDGRAYLVSGFELRYTVDHPGLPIIEELGQVEVELGKTESGYVAPREGVPSVRIRLVDAADRGAERYYGSALNAVTRAVLSNLNSRGFIAVLVSISPKDVFITDDPMDPDAGEDLRPSGRTAMGIDVYVARVTEVRTLAFGERIPSEERINNPKHERILSFSPIQTGVPGDEGGQDLLRKDLLDEYLFRLNRHPGRRVDVAVAAGPGSGVALDYLVNENKPWIVYGQVSNTGTRETDRWRQRFGFIHNQLTSNDDILSLDFITAAFDETNAFIGSYEAPFPGMERLRWRVFGSWNEFTASDVGRANERFTGDGWSAGAEVIANVYQHRELFVDLIAGFRWQNVSVNNEFVGIEGEDDFFIPSFGARVSRETDTSSTSALVKFEFNASGIAGTDRSEIEKLGRIDADEDFVTLQWDISHSFYLDPLINYARWRDTGPDGSPTLAHEIALSFRGQYAFDNRLVPNLEQVIGGLYSVRGYRESVVAGDTVLVGSVEYRWHIPRSLAIQPEPATIFGSPFRVAPQVPYGRPDWDLIARGFVDVGRAINSDRLPFESDETLVGAGFGLELLLKQNLSIRADFGWALEEIENEVSSGSSQFHFSATILF